MGGPLVIITGLIYLGVSVDQFLKHNPSMGITYLAYAFSNVGLYMALK